VLRVRVDKFVLSHVYILIFVVRTYSRLSSGAIPPAPGSSVEIGEPAQRPQSGHEAVFAAAIDDESGQSLEMAADWLIRDSEFTAIASAHQRVLFGGCADELAVVHPLPLDKLELPVKVRPDKGE
jgi:hypothetical protein